MPEPRRRHDWQASGAGRLQCTVTQAAPLLACVSFGDVRPSATADRLSIQVALRSLLGPTAEYWSGTGAPVLDPGAVMRSSADDAHQFAVIEVNERDHGGIAGAAEYAYRQILRQQQHSGYPHILRMWNYFPSINTGSGDVERYKQFCVGRAAALPSTFTTLPAASAIGTRAENGMLQVYWIAGRAPGLALENPRQTSAYCYPRQYGPASPSFSRAMLSNGVLFISGTASIVGHASQHDGDLQAQLDETLQNIDTVVAHAHQLDSRLPERLAAHSLMKLYVRHANDAAFVLQGLRARYGEGLPIIALEGDICRRELLLEIECVHSAADPR